MYRPALPAKLLEFLRETNNCLCSLKWTKLTPKVRPVGEDLLESGDTCHIFIARFLMAEVEGEIIQQPRELSPSPDSRNLGVIKLFLQFFGALERLPTKIRSDDSQQAVDDRGDSVLPLQGNPIRHARRVAAHVFYVDVVPDWQDEIFPSCSR